MSIQQMERRYQKSVMCIEKALEILRNKTGIDDNYYINAKYMRIACRTAYKGVLLAIEILLENKGVYIGSPGGVHLSVYDYRKALGRVDTNLLRTFNTVYNVLYLAGYQDGETNCGVIGSGIEAANDIVRSISLPNHHLTFRLVGHQPNNAKQSNATVNPKNY